MFVAQGPAHTRFARAVQRRELFRAEVAAREMGRMSLNEALALVCLYASEGSPKFEAAAVRWLCRLALEERGTLATMQRGAEALTQLRAQGREEAGQTLQRLLWGSLRQTGEQHVDSAGRRPID
jgi:type II secretory pathway component PulM